MFFTTYIKDSNDKLLEKFYNDLLMPNFGIDPNELDDLETFQEALNLNFHYTLHIVLIVDEFENIIAGLSCEYYPKSKCSLLTYIAVKPEYQGKGLTKTLISELNYYLKQYHPENLALFAESNSDDVDKTKDVMDPKLRRKILNNIGFKYLGINYIQPPLSENKSKCKNLLLGVYNQDPSIKSIKSEIVLNWIKEFYEVLIGENYLEDKDLKNIIKLYSKTEYFLF